MYVVLKCLTFFSISTFVVDRQSTKFKAKKKTQNAGVAHVDVATQYADILEPSFIMIEFVLDE